MMGPNDIESEIAFNADVASDLPVTNYPEAFISSIQKLEKINSDFIVPTLNKIAFNTSFLTRSKNQTSKSLGQVDPSIKVIAKPDKVTTEDRKQVILQSDKPLKSTIVKAVKEISARTPNKEPVNVPLEDQSQDTDQKKKRVPRHRKMRLNRQARKPIGQTKLTEEQASVTVTPVRDSKGRFIGKNKRRQDGQGKQKNPETGKKSGVISFAAYKGKEFAKEKKGTLLEAAGRTALGGPLFDVLKEVKESWTDYRERGRSLRNEYKEFKGEDFEDQGPQSVTLADAEMQKTTANTETIAELLQNTEKEDEERHKEIIKAILNNEDDKDKETVKDKKTLSLLKSLKKKDGKKPQIPIAAQAQGGLAGGMKKGGGMLKGVMSMLNPLKWILGPLAAGIAGVAIGSLINKGINSLVETVTGQKGETLGGQVYDITHKESSKTSTKGYQEQKATISEASKATGISEDTMTKLAGVESSFNAQAGAKGSSAKGMYQFTDATWNDMKKKYGAKHGVSNNASVYDARANALMAGEYARENKEALENAGVRADDTSIYMSHFLGTKGGVNFMKTLQGGGGNRVAALDFKEASKTNENIFYDSKTGQGRTYEEIYALLSSRLDQYSKERMEGQASGKDVSSMASADKRVEELEAEYKTTGKNMTPDQRLEWGGKMRTARAEANKNKTLAQTTIEAKQEQEPNKQQTTIKATGVSQQKISQPSRITEYEKMQKTAAGGTQSENPINGKAAVSSGTNTVNIPGIDKLVTLMTNKQASEKTHDGQQIRTEFDDTTLTLMAYDRV